MGMIFWTLLPKHTYVAKTANGVSNFLAISSIEKFEGEFKFFPCLISDILNSLPLALLVFSFAILFFY